VIPTAVSDTTPPSAPTDLIGVGGLGTASLSWSPATDNIAVFTYNVHHSTISGVAPSAVNRIVQTSIPSLNITGIPPGTYFYVVTAEDASGNVSGASNEAAVVVIGDAAAPSVAITAPADQASVSGSVAITASATDDVGVIGVQFQIDGAALSAETVNAPYATTWDTALDPNGSHTITAVARDAAGNRSEATIAVTVTNTVPDTTPPVVSLTAPADGSTLAGSVAVTATATDAAGVMGVQFQVDGVALGAEVLSAPYAAIWGSTTVANGPHTVTAIARDAAGSRSDASVTIEVLNVVEPPPPPVTGLVAAYGFNEGAGTQAGDGSGSGNNGTILRAAWSTAGHTGAALSFGNNAWVTIADAASLDLNTGMTLEAWVRPTSNGSTRTVIYKERSSGLSYALFSSDADADPRTTVRTNVSVSANGSTLLRTNVWTHLAATYDGSTLRLFVDGVEVDSTPSGLPMAVSAGPLRIGGNSIRGEYFRGLIDEVRIYNRALSATEIRADMDTPVR
jgi:hypothetical protein